jgi:hypothetical protein
MVSLKQVRDHLAHHDPQSDFHPICQVEFRLCYTSVHQSLKMVSFKQIRDHLACHGPQSDFHPISQVEFLPGYTLVHQPPKMVSLKQIRDHLARHGPQSDFHPISQVEFNMVSLTPSSRSGTTWFITVLSQTSNPLAR